MRRATRQNQQNETKTIETRSAPASLGATHRAFTFYLGNPFPRFCLFCLNLCGLYGHMIGVRRGERPTKSVSIRVIRVDSHSASTLQRFNVSTIQRFNGGEAAVFAFVSRGDAVVCSPTWH